MFFVSLKILPRASTSYSVTHFKSSAYTIVTFTKYSDTKVQLTSCPTMVFTVVFIEHHHFRTIIESTTKVLCETNKICFHREVSSTKVKFLRRFPLKLQALVNLLFQCFDKWKPKFVAVVCYKAVS